MRRDRRFAGRLLRVRKPFEERSTSASSLLRGRELPCRFRRGCEPVGDWTAVSARLLLQLLPARLWSYQPPRLTRDRCTQLALLGHAQGCLESRHWFYSREDAALA
jgi:hypothetical protein